MVSEATPVTAPAGKTTTKGPWRPGLSVPILVVANLFPLFGVLRLGWNASDILLLYWGENAIIGIWNLLKMSTAKGAGPAGPKLLFLLFFAVHYGFFMAVHYFFLVSFLSKGFGPPGFSLDLLRGVGPGLLVLFLSHGISFLANYIGRGEYLGASTARLVFQPYGRIVVMHLTIIFGAGLMMLTGQSIVLLVTLILFKTAVDGLSHLKERKKFGLVAARPPAAGLGT